MIVVISSSTGGPDALKVLFKGLGDKSTPPMIVVQHMKAGITASLTKRLGEISKATVLEITDGMVLKKGHVYVCPGGYNVTLEKNGTAYVFRLNCASSSHHASPNADVLLESLEKTDMKEILCVTLSGMGKDSLKGIIKLKNTPDKKVVVYTQSKDSCVIYGMPKAIDMVGLSDCSYDIGDMTRAIKKHIGDNGGM